VPATHARRCDELGKLDDVVKFGFHFLDVQHSLPEPTLVRLQDVLVLLLGLPEHVLGDGKLLEVPVAVHVLECH
jgi:hypothetical protein